MISFCNLSKAGFDQKTALFDFSLDLLLDHFFFLPFPPPSPAFKTFGTLSFCLLLESDFALSLAFSVLVFP